MADTYQIINHPAAVLKETAHPVETITNDVKKQVSKMFETMYAANGIGLAANQVGLLNRVFVMNIERDQLKKGNPVCMINPKIVKASEEMSRMDEGCLSIPGMYAAVERPAQIVATYLDVDGNECTIEADGLLSHCIQHELDHLNGVLFIDHLSTLKRNMLLKKYKKTQKNIL